MSCSNGQCGIGRPIEFIGGPIDGHIQQTDVLTNLMCVIIGKDQKLVNGKKIAIYQLDETESRYLFRNETIYHQPLF